jgi:hypothetical protein
LRSWSSGHDAANVCKHTCEIFQWDATVPKEARRSTCVQRDHTRFHTDLYRRTKQHCINSPI